VLSAFALLGGRESQAWQRPFSDSFKAEAESLGDREPSAEVVSNVGCPDGLDDAAGGWEPEADSDDEGGKDEPCRGLELVDPGCDAGV
jgi:hypothetical protein